MKQWTNEDLILFYYGELSHNERHELTRALETSPALKQTYDELCAFLDNDVNIDVPEPSHNLNQRIMASIHQLDEKNADKHSQQRDRSFNFGRWFTALPSIRIMATTLSIALVTLSVFYLGRWSTNQPDTPKYVQQPDNSANTTATIDEATSRRILLQNVSLHLQQTDRLLTQVSNGNGDLPTLMASRRQAIEEMIAFNRLYRRLMENSGDTLMVNLLQQMEAILVELSHTDQSSAPQDWQNLRERIDANDLLFKVRVSDKTIKQKTV